MKYLFFLLILTLPFVGVQASTSEPIYRFTTEKATFENLSASQKNSIINATGELSNFINEQIIGQLPKPIKKEIEDMKIKIVLSDKEGRDGLFIPGENNEHVIFIKLIQVQSNGIKSLLAHEFFHAIHYHINPDELPWVREGLAQIYEYMTTKNLNGINLSAAINNPLTPLLGEYSPEEKNPAQYGHNQLYFLYLYSHCGKDNIFWSIAKGKPGLKGSFLIDQIMSDLSSESAECKDFNESVVSFLVAKHHNQIQFTSKVDLEKNKYFISSMDIAPKRIVIKSESELQRTLSEMPVLSSLKFSLTDFKKNKGKCLECEFFYSNTNFPFDVTQILPKKEAEYDIIAVKLRRK